MTEYLKELLTQNPEGFAALFSALFGGPLAAVLKSFRRNRCLIAALRRMNEKHSDELNTLRRENAQLIENHAAALKSLREQNLRRTRELTNDILKAFTKGL